MKDKHVGQIIRTNKSLFFPLNYMCLAEKQQFKHVTVLTDKKDIPWSVTGYSENISCQWTLTAKIKPVQDEYKYRIFRSVYLKTIHYITEILLKVALNTITLTMTQIRKNTGVSNNHNNRMEKQAQVYQTITIIEWRNKHRCTKQSP
jgi:hypothetical protein